MVWLEEDLRECFRGSRGDIDKLRADRGGVEGLDLSIMGEFELIFLRDILLVFVYVFVC